MYLLNSASKQQVRKVLFILFGEDRSWSNRQCKIWLIMKNEFSKLVCTFQPCKYILSRSVGTLYNIQTRLGLQCRNPLRSYHLTLIPCRLSLIPTHCPLSPRTVPFKKFRWGLLFLLLLLLLSQAKVKSAPSPRPKTGVWQYSKTFLSRHWRCQV